MFPQRRMAEALDFMPLALSPDSPDHLPTADALREAAADTTGTTTLVLADSPWW
jgi:hypothetical protein